MLIGQTESWNQLHYKFIVLALLHQLDQNYAVPFVFLWKLLYEEPGNDLQLIKCIDTLNLI